MKSSVGFGMNPISARRLIRNIGPGSQSFLIACDDGDHYVLKLAGDPHRPNLLANELIGGALAVSVGLPIQEAKPVSVSAEFCEDIGAFMKDKPLSFSPQAGLHLAIRCEKPLAGSFRPIQYLGQSNAKNVSNRRDFLGMILFDMWAGQEGRRDTLFVRTGKGPALRAVFSSNGELFGGAAWNALGLKPAFCAGKLSLYREPCDESELSFWTRTFMQQLPRSINNTLAMVPPQWHREALSLLERMLLERLSEFERLTSRHIGSKTSRAPEGYLWRYDSVS